MHQVAEKRDETYKPASQREADIYGVIKLISRHLTTNEISEVFKTLNDYYIIVSEYGRVDKEYFNDLSRLIETVIEAVETRDKLMAKREYPIFDTFTKRLNRWISGLKSKYEGGDQYYYKAAKIMEEAKIRALGEKYYKKYVWLKEVEKAIEETMLKGIRKRT